jgi:hypothetical protein
MSAPNAPETDPPFRKHRYYYLALKIVVLLCAAYFALRVMGYL